MLKDLDKITELSLQYELTRSNYRAAVDHIKTILKERFANEPLLKRYNIIPNDDGELLIENASLYIDRQGSLQAERLLISPENILRIAAILQESVL